MPFDNYWANPVASATSGGNIDNWWAHLPAAAGTPTPTLPLPVAPGTPNPTAAPAETAPPAMPNLQDLLGGDPIYQQFLASLNAQGVQSQAQRDAAIQRAIIMFGGLPGGFDQYSNLTGGVTVDPQTAALAQQNTTAGLSTLARLNQANDKALADISGTLAARGIFRSGATGVALANENKQFTQAQYDATQKLVDYLAGVQSAYVAAQQAQQNSVYQAQLQALANWLATHPGGLTPPTGTPGSTPPGASAAPPIPPQPFPTLGHPGYL